jgi:hypothetical protein
MECRLERRRIQMMESQRRRYKPTRSIKVQCRFPDGCTKLIVRSGQSYMRKYCDEHAKVMSRRSHTKASLKAYHRRREAAGPRKCEFCDSLLALHKRKYCGEACRYRGANRITRKRNLKEKIRRSERLIKKYQDLKEKAIKELKEYGETG